jgi:putative spermidine/putrescine transport system ATP-binding protein
MNKAPLARAREVRLEAVEKSFDGATRVVDRVDLVVQPGEFFALLGPSGCGKTTTLRMIAGFEEPDAGRILVGGEDITHVPVHARDMGMIFQSYALFPHRTVAENVAFGLRMRGLDKGEIRERVAQALRQVALEGFDARRPAQLSGGQQQRVALARAIVIRPRVLLCDEPLAALDRKLRQSMQLELKGLQRELGVTTIFVTHDQEEAMTISDRIAVMNGGRIEQIGSAREVYNQPRTRFVADFIGDINVLAGEGAAMIAIRPERLRLVDPAQAKLKGRVDTRTFISGQSVYRIALESGRHLTAKLNDASADFAVGAEVGVAWHPGDVVVLKE